MGWIVAGLAFCGATLLWFGPEGGWPWETEAEADRRMRRRIG